jgi:D-glycero-alpha-D-manno-heptose-7-phosphate kinase
VRSGTGAVASSPAYNPCAPAPTDGGSREAVEGKCGSAGSRVILTRTPFRVSIGGGGTDLPSYYGRRGGAVISAAIDKYVYVAINATFTDDYLLKYSVHERVGRAEDIQHALIREVLLRYDVQPGVEIVSVADIPAGTGLGSSGSFTVGLLRALHAHTHRQCSIADLAEEACHIEIDRLADPVGKQDQYIAAFGGLTRFSFRPDDSVGVERLTTTKETLADLEDHLLLFFTDYSRDAATILADQKVRSEHDDAAMIANLDYVNDLGHRIGSALESGDTMKFAELMHEHWMYKRQRSDGITNPQIDDWYDIARRNGALGGKLVGAGAGGFLLFYAEEPRRLRRAMMETGLPEVRFGFDHDGSVVLARS